LFFYWNLNIALIEKKSNKIRTDQGIFRLTIQAVKSLFCKMNDGV